MWPLRTSAEQSLRHARMLLHTESQEDTASAAEHVFEAMQSATEECDRDTVERLDEALGDRLDRMNGLHDPDSLRADLLVACELGLDALRAEECATA